MLGILMHFVISHWHLETGLCMFAESEKVDVIFTLVSLSPVSLLE